MGEEVGLAVAELSGLPVDESLAVRPWKGLGNAVIKERPNGDGSTGRVRGSWERMVVVCRVEVMLRFGSSRYSREYAVIFGLRCR